MYGRRHLHHINIYITLQTGFSCHRNEKRYKPSSQTSFMKKNKQKFLQIGQQINKHRAQGRKASNFSTKSQSILGQVN